MMLHKSEGPGRDLSPKKTEEQQSVANDEDPTPNAPPSIFPFAFVTSNVGGREIFSFEAVRGSSDQELLI